MKRVLAALAILTSLGGFASATTLEFSLSSSPTLRAGIGDLDVAGGSLGLGVSNRALDASFTRGLDLSVVGTLQGSLNAAYAYGQGLRLGAAASGTLGPVAASAALAYWNAPAASVDPLLPYSQAGTDPSPAGLQASLNVRYRLNRPLVLSVGGVLGHQDSLTAGLEYRTGGFTYRGGLRAGRDVLGLTAGLSAPVGDSAQLAADLLLGPHSLGVTGSLSLDTPFGDGSDLSAYLAYEPWRQDALPLRYGVSADLPAGSGSLNLAVMGGSGGAGLRAAYRLPLTP